MDKKQSIKSAITDSVAARLKAKDSEPTEHHGLDVTWVRKDGAICVGNECIVIKRLPDSKILDIEIAPTKCGELTGSLLLEHLLKTVGKGGSTRFTVKSDLVEEPEVKES